MAPRSRTPLQPHQLAVLRELVVRDGFWENLDGSGCGRVDAANTSMQGEEGGDCLPKACGGPLPCTMGQAWGWGNRHCCKPRVEARPHTDKKEQGLFPSRKDVISVIPMKRAHWDTYIDAMNGALSASEKEQLAQFIGSDSLDQPKKLTTFLTGARTLCNVGEAQLECDAVSIPKVKAMLANMRRSKKANKGVLPPTLVFSNFVKSGTSIIAEQLKASKVVTSSQMGVITGSVSNKNRQAIVEGFNAGRIKLVVSSPAGFAGLDYKGVRNVHLLDGGWNPESTAQATARAVRRGSHLHLPTDQQNVTMYHYFMRAPKRLPAHTPIRQCADEILKIISDRKGKAIAFSQGELKKGPSVDGLRWYNDLTDAAPDKDHPADVSDMEELILGDYNPSPKQARQPRAKKSSSSSPDILLTDLKRMKVESEACDTVRLWDLIQVAKKNGTITAECENALAMDLLPLSRDITLRDFIRFKKDSSSSIRGGQSMGHTTGMRQFLLGDGTRVLMH